MLDRQTKERLLAEQALEGVRRLLEHEAKQKFLAHYASLKDDEFEKAWHDEWMPDRFVRVQERGEWKTVVLTAAEALRRRKVTDAGV